MKREEIQKRVMAIVSVIVFTLLVIIDFRAFRSGEGGSFALCTAAIIGILVDLLLSMKQASVLDASRIQLKNVLVEEGIITDQLFKEESYGEVLEILQQRLQETSLTETLKTRAELHALQNQINPHFLYNTLEIIRSRALIQGNEDVAKMSEALALQFRYCINQSGDLATLRQELDHIRNYLLIQHYRFQDRFHFHEDIEDIEQLGNCRMPILTLQPIIENALIHGVNPKIEGGNITLQIRTSGEKMFLSVIDDGVGMDEPTLKKMRNALHSESIQVGRSENGRKTPGIALHNVNERVKLYFGSEYGLDIASTEGIGTTVTLVIPIVFMGEDG